MGWRMDSTAGAHIWDTEPLSAEDIACRDEELEWLKRHEQRSWTLINGRLAESGEPVALNGVYGGLNAFATPADLTTKTSVSGDVLLMTAAEIAAYTPIPPQSLKSPTAFEVFMSGAYTTSTTPGNLTVTPRMGQLVTSPSLGASAAMALTASITTGGWTLKGRLTVRSVGAPGTNSTALGLFNWEMTSAALPAAAALDHLFGHTIATFDQSAAVANGLAIGLTHTVATVTYIPRQVHWSSWD